MKLPSSVPIFGVNVKVVEVSPCKDDDGNEVDGTYDAKTLTINIDKKSNSETKIHTLIHEMGHAMFDRVSLGQTDIDSQIEEIIVNNYATFMTEVFNLRFRRNK